MKLLHKGVDTLDFAVQGALAKNDLLRLRDAKSLASQLHSESLTQIGPDGRPVVVGESGRRGGYAFTFHTGALGAIYAVKDNPDPNQWNVFVSIRSSTLAAHGYEAARDLILSELRTLGCSICNVSVARIDYAMDFLVNDFTLDPNRFVAHPHARVVPRFAEAQLNELPDAVPVFRGRHVESITIGKMPGRQVIVYDKRYAAIKKRDLFWFEVWKIDIEDKSLRVWRVEVRAGKRELKERWQVSTFDSLDLALGDIVRETLASIRYHAAYQTDSNVSRQWLDPLWVAASEASAAGLTNYTSGLLPSRIREIEHEKALLNYTRQITGNAGGLAAVAGIPEKDLEYELPRLISQIAAKDLAQDRSSVKRSAARSRDRLHFVLADPEVVEF